MTIGEAKAIISWAKAWNMNPSKNAMNSTGWTREHIRRAQERVRQYDNAIAAMEVA